MDNGQLAAWHTVALQSYVRSSPDVGESSGDPCSDACHIATPRHKFAKHVSKRDTELPKYFSAHAPVLVR